MVYTTFPVFKTKRFLVEVEVVVKFEMFEEDKRKVDPIEIDEGRWVREV